MTVGAIGRRGLTRRDLVRYGGAWVAAGLVLGGCSGDDEGGGTDRDDGGAGPATTGRAAPGDGGGSVTIRDVRIFDGEAVVDADTVVVEGGLITAVGRGLEPPDGVEVHEGDGGVLLPGLIDAHGHTNDVSQLADGLRFGTTTVLDMFSQIGANDVGAELRAQRARLTRTEQADFWSAGILVTVAGGHGTQFGFPIPVLAPGDDADEFVAARVEEGSDFVKIVIEDGTQAGTSLPTLDAQQVEAVVAAAHDRDLLAVAHTTTWAAAQIAAAAGTDLLAHAPGDRLPGDDVLRRIVDAGTGVVATLAVRVGVSCTDDARRLRDDPAVADDLSEAQRAALGRTSPTCFHGRLDNALANVRALHEAGVPILAGTDFPNPGTAPGPSMLLEVELLTRAGLAPEDALRSATSLTADTFGLDDRGRIAPGRRGDLLLVPGDATTDVTRLRDVSAVWKNGFPIDRTP